MRPKAPPMRPRAISLGAQEELRSYVASEPPPAELADAQARLEQRLRGAYPRESLTGDDEVSAIHDLHDVQRRQRNADIAAVADRFELEHERRVTAEANLKARDDRGWSIVVGVLIAVIAAAIIGGGVALIHAERETPRQESRP